MNPAAGARTLLPPGFMSKVPRQSESGGIDSTGNATSGASSAARPRQHPPPRPLEAPPLSPPAMFAGGSSTKR